MTSADGPRVAIAVAPAEALAARPRLLGALEQLLPVRFVAAGGAQGVAGQLLFGAGSPAAGVPAFVVGDGAGDESAPAGPVTLADDPGVDGRLRGATLHDRLDAVAPAVAPGDRVLARAAGGAAVWVRTDGRVPLDRVGSALPELGDGDVLYDLLAERAIAVVGLIQFLRGLAGPAGWTPAPLRATIVFDDPNLRWRSYGFIDYARLATHAREHGYHAAMAMIPIDAGRAHPRALELFSRRPGPLSLNIHGNDHNAAELLEPRDEDAAQAFAAQALRRVERFERRTGLAVDRVMMPPHGRCSPAMARALGAVGFDALSAIHPLPWTNDWRTGPVLTGMRPAEFVGGCPVIPRMSLASSRSDVGLRAFLEHPVVLYGHHQDVAGGLEPLAEAARTVSALGAPEWTSAGQIALGNAQTRLVDGTLQVRAYSRRLLLDPPDGARSVTVAAPQDAVAGDALAGWSVDGGTITPFGEPLPVAGPHPLTLRLHGRGDVLPQALKLPVWQPWPKLRRIATEARDRVAPLRAAS